MRSSLLCSFLLIFQVVQGFVPVPSVLTSVAATNALKPATRGHRHLTGLKMAESADEKPAREPFPVGRFFKTLAFFNAPRPLAAVKKVLKREYKQPDQWLGVTLVNGAGSPITSSVVSKLLTEGSRVRVLTPTSADGALRKLGEKYPKQLEIITCDPGDSAASVRPSHVTDVTRIVTCGGRPTALKSLASAVKRYGDVEGKVLYGSAPGISRKWEEWGELSDYVMGGVSESSITVQPGEGEEGGRSLAAVFAGVGRAENNGGFASVRTRLEQLEPFNLKGYDAIRLRVKGDGFRYKLVLYDAAGWDRPSWCYSFDTKKDGKWEDITIPFAKFIPIFRTKKVQSDGPLSETSIYSLQLMLSKFEYEGKLNPTWKPGPFSLVVDSIKAVNSSKTQQPPKWVHITGSNASQEISALRGTGVDYAVLQLPERTPERTPEELLSSMTSAFQTPSASGIVKKVDDKSYSV